MIDEHMIGQQIIGEKTIGEQTITAPPPPSCPRPLPDPALCEAEELTGSRLLATGYRLPAASQPHPPIVF